VDNDISVSELNRKIVNQTLKYMFYHSPENRAYCLMTYGHELDGEEVYTTQINDLLCQADLMEYQQKDSNLTDVLASVLTNWKNSDFACRDIVVFTDGLEETEINYEKEELYYLINNTSYPVYVVYLVQDNNQEAKKGLSAIATTSDGQLFLSEFEGDDGGVDRQITEAIFAKMDEYALREWSIYEQDENVVNNLDNRNAEDNYASEDANAYQTELEQTGLEQTGLEQTEQEQTEQEQTEQEQIEELLTEEMQTVETEVLYENETIVPFFERPSTLIFVLIFIFVIVIGGLTGGLFVLKSRRKEAHKEQEICDFVAKNTSTKDFFETDPFENELAVTRQLSPDDYDDGKTRLLAGNVHSIEFVDEKDNANTLRMSISERALLGRKKDICDYCIDDDSVSKKHCELLYENEELYISDLGSSNGTYVNGQRIIRVKLKDNDKVKIGFKTYIVRIV